MELTGKTKEQFEAWWHEEYLFGVHHIVGFTLDDFYNTPLTSMKFGVYVDYFDSVDVVIEIRGRYSQHWFRLLTESPMDFYESKDTFQFRKEARIAAIEKANEIQNEKLKG